MHLRHQLYLQCYTILFIILSPLLFLYFAWRSRKEPQYRRRWSERLGALPCQAQAQTIWVHAASVGEVTAARPLIKQLQATYPQHRILVTTMTPTGSAMVRTLFQDSVLHQYIPIDIPWCIRRFLRHHHFELGLIIETELWPNLIRQCAKQQIPLILCNAQISPRSIKHYRRFKTLIGPLLETLTTIAAESSDDALRFIELGVDSAKVHVVGNLKYDLPRKSQHDHAYSQNHPPIQQIKNPIFIAASTHEGEETAFLNILPTLKQTYPNLLFVLAPRHPGRFDRVATLIRDQQLSFVRYSQQPSITPQTEVLLIDSIGQLNDFFPLCQVAFIGGSLVPIGGHNLIEPAQFGTPICSGPHLDQCQAISTLFKQHDALTIIPHINDLATSLLSLLEPSLDNQEKGQRAQRVCESLRGSVKRHLILINKTLQPLNRIDHTINKPASAKTL